MQPHAPHAQLLTPAAAAEYLGLQPTTLECWRTARKGPPYVKVGWLVRYRAADLEAWIEAQTVTHPREAAG